MFMDLNGALSSNVNRKEHKYVFWELMYELWINNEFYKENTKFSELNNFYCIQWLIGSKKNSLIGLIDEIWEVRRVLTQKQCKLGRASPRYALLNQHVSLSALHSYYPFQSLSNVLLHQPNLVNVILNQATPQWPWNRIGNPS